MPPFAFEAAAARVAQESWSRLSVRDRLRPIRALRNLIVGRADALCEAAHADIGRTPVEVMGTELLPTAAALKFLEKEAARLLAPRGVPRRLRPTWLMGCRDVVHHRPWGVVGIIGTWNYPIFLNFGQIAQALVAGNAVLWKPSENSVQTAEVTHELFLAAGFPKDLLQLLPATREAGPELAEAEIDHLVFTGSDGVGRRLAAKLGERLVPSTLELSGCDVMFVLPDANLEMAARAAWFGVTLNRGQTCIAVRRIFVPREKAEVFAHELRKLVPNGKPMALVTPGQVTQADRLIADAVARGATALAPTAWTAPTEGSAGSTVSPTFLLNTPHDAAICMEACFSPLAAVIPYDSIDSAVSQARQSPFGLAASVFSADTTAARELAARIPAGNVCINDVLAPTAHPATPFGGLGASGWGVTQGAEGLLGMTVPQAVTVRKGTFRPHFDQAAKPDPSTINVLRGLLRSTHASGLVEKWRGFWQLIRGLWRKK